MFIVLAALVACGPTATKPAGDATTQVAAGSRTDTDITGMERALAEGALVVDVRTPGEWAQGHVPGAKHLPLSSLSADHAILKGHDKSKPVYFVCESGGRSGKAADAMAASGFDTVNVKGGTGAWRRASKPLETP